MGKSLLPATLAVVIALGAVAPAFADEHGWREREWHEHERRDREWREHEWRVHHPYYAAPPVVVAPPPAYYPPPPVYAPPPVAPGISVILPIHIR